MIGDLVLGIQINSSQSNYEGYLTFRKQFVVQTRKVLCAHMRVTETTWSRFPLVNKYQT